MAAGADDGSDETFLEQTKVKAHYDSALWSRPNSELEDLGNTFLGDGEDAGPDETFLEQPSSKPRSFGECVFKTIMTRTLGFRIFGQAS